MLAAVRTIVETIADHDSVLEIRKKFGIGIITAFIRVEGRPIEAVGLQIGSKSVMAPALKNAYALRGDKPKLGTAGKAIRMEGPARPSL